MHNRSTSWEDAWKVSRNTNPSWLSPLSNSRRPSTPSIRSLMFSVLHPYGIPKAVVSAIQVLYTNSSSAVKVDGGISESFVVTTGVLQGDVLAPFLFIILVDHILGMACEAKPGVVIHPPQSKNGIQLNRLMIWTLLMISLCSLSHPFQGLSHSFQAADAAADQGLIISLLKTEHMTINCHPQTPLQV